MWDGSSWGKWRRKKNKGFHRLLSVFNEELDKMIQDCGVITARSASLLNCRSTIHERGQITEVTKGKSIKIANQCHGKIDITDLE